MAGGNGEGNAPNQLALPLGLTVSNSGDVFVADTYNHRVQHWKPGAKKGITILSANDFKGDLSLNYFSGITLVDDHLLFITDYEEKRILQYNLTLKTISIVAANSSLDNENEKLSQPYQIALDLSGHLIIADAKNNRIQKWKPKTE